MSMPAKINPHSTPATSSPESNLVEAIFTSHRKVEELIARRRNRAEDIERMGVLRGLGEQGRARAGTRIARLPARDVLHDELELIHQSIFEPATELQIRALIGVMLDALPTAGAQVKVTYLDAMTETVKHTRDEGEGGAAGFSAAVLARSIRMVWARFKFPPAIAEFITVAREARAEFCVALRLTERLIDIRIDAEDLVDATDPETTDPETSDSDWDELFTTQEEDRSERANGGDRSDAAPHNIRVVQQQTTNPPRTNRQGPKARAQRAVEGGQRPPSETKPPQG